MRKRERPLRKMACRLCCCVYCGAPARASVTAELGSAPAAGNPEISISVLTAADRAEAVQCHMRGTKGDGDKPGEGMQTWIADGDKSLDDAGKKNYFEFNSKYNFLMGRNFGGVHLGARIDGKIVGVLTAYPPGAVIEHGSCGECCACLHLCCCKLGCKMVMVKPRSEMAEKAFGSKALKDARTDLKRYWVLESMSVDPAFQSKGVGTALLGAITHLAKNDGAPMVVEFVGDRLKGFYGNRGFAVPDTFYELKDGDDAIKVYAGVWNPGAGAGAAGNQVAPTPEEMMR